MEYMKAISLDLLCIQICPWKWAIESDIPVKYSDRSGMIGFFKEPQPIDKVVFKGITKSFEISNPSLIQELLQLTLEFREDNKEKRTNKKKQSAKIIKMIATEIYKELTEKERITGWKSLCIIGFVFCLFNIGLKADEPLLSEEKFNLANSERQVSTETYLQYLSGRIKRYINI